MNPAGRQTNQHVPRTNPRTGDQAILIHHACRKARKIEVAPSIEIGHFGRLPAEQSGIGFSLDAANHLIDDLRRVRVQRGGQIIEELGAYVEPVQLQVVCSQLWSSLSS